MEHSQDSDLKTSEKPQDNLRSQRKHSSSILIFVGILIFVFGAFNYYRIRILSFSKVPPSVLQATQDIDIPAEIIIPSIKIDLKVDPGNINDGVWQISANNATFLTISSPPGSGGNTVIYGHNRKVIFGNLPYVSVGQKIVVKTKSGKIFNYLIDKKYFVSPDRVDLVSPTTNTELTVYTCYGLFDNQRAVIVAKPI